MRHCLVSFAAFVLLFGGWIPQSAGAAPTARHCELRDQLAQPVKFDGVEQGRATLGEALDVIAKRYHLQFDINEEAFKQAKIKDVAGIKITENAAVPEMHAKLGIVLRKILSRVSPSATYVVRDDLIEITTTDAVRKEFFADRPALRGPLPPLVSASFDKQPLETALKKLGDDGSVVLDRRCAKEAQTAVTAELVNVPLDTAVRMIADMGGLKVVPLDNALYVTSKDNARVLLKERKKLRRAAQRREKKEKAEEKAKTPPAKPDPTKKETSDGRP
jgi:hypothetical protein